MSMLPHDIETEKALLCSLLIDPSRKAGITDIIGPDDFYLEKHRHLYSALLKLDAPDIPMLKTILENKGALQKAGGMAYLAEIMAGGLTSGGAAFYAERLQNLSTRRALAQTGQALFQNACNLTKDVSEVISQTKGSIRDTEQNHRRDQADPTEILDRVFRDIETRSQTGKHAVGTLSGYDAIDRHLNGFEPKTLTYLIARPSVGKTALALNMAENFARQDVGAVVFFSLEMSAEAITRRRLAAESGIYLSRIRAGNLEEHQWTGLVSSLNALSSRPFVVLDSPRFKAIEDLTGKSETISMDTPTCAIFVDHVQLMRTRQKFGTRHLEMSFISNELKALAKNLDVPVIALSQLNRGVEHRTNKRPNLSDMKESGDLEQDGDVVIGLFRETKESDRLELAGLKGRDVGTWTGVLRFNRYTQKISEYED